MKQRIKLMIIIGVEFLCVLTILLLIFFAGKKTYTVEFDLNGGILLNGDLVQKVVQGGSATAPNVTKDGCDFLGWTVSYKKVTKDIVTRAIWEYETTPGIEYRTNKNTNFCTIVSCHRDLVGPVYIGAYFNDYKVLEIEKDAFAGCQYITEIYLLDGIIKIQEGAFANCPALTYIELPGTAIEIGKEAFEGCKSLKEVVLPKGLRVLGDNAFYDCDSLEKVTMPNHLDSLGETVFNSDDVEIIFNQTEDEVNELYGVTWYQANPKITYLEEDEEDKKGASK